MNCLHFLTVKLKAVTELEVLWQVQLNLTAFLSALHSSGSHALFYKHSDFFIHITEYFFYSIKVYETDYRRPTVPTHFLLLGLWVDSECLYFIYLYTFLFITL